MCSVINVTPFSFLDWLIKQKKKKTDTHEEDELRRGISLRKVLSD